MFASASAAPAQEDPADAGGSTEQALVDIDVNAADGDPAAIASTLDDLAANVETQLNQLELARVAVHDARSVLADRETAIAETEARIEAIIGSSDAVVIRAFMSPPNESAVEVFTEPSPTDATVKKALLDIADALLTREVLDAEQVRKLARGEALEDVPPSVAARPTVDDGTRDRPRDKGLPTLVPQLPKPLTQE